MLSLGTLVAIAASGAAIFVVSSVFVIVVWVRIRKERHALRVLGLKHGQYTRSIGLTGDTLTELSQEEGTILRGHGLPYGKPTEWGQLSSREALLRSKNGSDSSFPLLEKARSFRNSISRSRSKRLSRSSHKHSRMSSMATMSESIIHHSPPWGSESREDIPLSAVEGVLELPAERTPRQTPDLSHEEPGFHLGMRPVSPSWPLPSQKERSGLFPVLESRSSQEMFDPPPRIFEESPSRVRGGSLTSQTPGSAPDGPIPPPPPTAFPLDRMSYMRNDSIMRLSSLSLDTTNSSILDDGRQRPVDTHMISPIFPSGGTSVPFSANDVGVKNGLHKDMDQYHPTLSAMDRYHPTLNAMDRYHPTLNAMDRYHPTLNAMDRYHLTHSAMAQYLPTRKDMDPFPPILKGTVRYEVELVRLKAIKPGLSSTGDIPIPPCLSLRISVSTSSPLFGKENIVI
ncbi:hypothetical protein N7478_007621 [Penicillium angulare]|uniref:uncharacterized protein n=1 Tax=Penicillium angulare TaxID=116970 RepID=UPI0025410BEE|nr:uncharacterized protein N7478_007621 [Penicillium angulare]KAJ5272496.1 hypothetical protein N7478_007621 [Penicillium angulare]